MLEPNKHKLNLSEIERNNLASFLLQRSSNLKLKYGAKKEAARIFGVDVKTVWKAWKATVAHKQLGQPLHLKSMKKGSVKGTQKVLDEEKIKSLSILERCSIRKFAVNMGVSICVVQRHLREKKVKARTNAIKTLLTPANKLCRLKWSLSMLSCISSNGRINFQPMFNIIHVDEKWFNMTQQTQRYYIAAGEKPQHRTCKNKQHIDKVMFICAIGRPIMDLEGNEIFDGKFGIKAFTYQEPAARHSKNRPKGTMLTKPIIAITKAVMKDAFINWLVPTIISKWPKGISKNIFIQQDNARPHISNNDPEFQAIAHSQGFNIQLINQPPNSPDCNVNDLGFFRAIQSLKDEKNATTVEGLVKNVKDAFEAFPSEKINDVFLTLQGCHREIINVRGCNDYNTPHMGKGAMKLQGTLPQTLDIDEESVKEAFAYLALHDIGDQPIHNIDNIIEGMREVELQEAE